MEQGEEKEEGGGGKRTQTTTCNLSYRKFLKQPKVHTYNISLSLYVSRSLSYHLSIHQIYHLPAYLPITQYARHI